MNASVKKMNVLEMVDYFLELGMSEEQAEELADIEWQAQRGEEIDEDDELSF